MSNVPSMNLEDSLKNISRHMAVFAFQIEADNAMGFFDKNRVAEDVLIPLFREVYGYSDLINLNEQGETYPGIDLGDRTNRVAFQISSKVDSTKVKDTLQSFINYTYYKEYDRLIIYDITTKQRSFTEAGWDQIIDGKFSFSKEDGVLDFTDVLKSIRHLDLDKTKRIEAILENHFTNWKVPVNELISRHFARQIAKEKNSKKYIPDVFVEVSDVKDNARFFSHPVLFFQKILDEFLSINLDELNLYLGKLSIPLIQPTLPVLELTDLSIETVNGHVTGLLETMKELHHEVSPYGFPYTTSVEITSVPESKKYIYDSMKYRLGAAASPLIRQVGNIIENLELMLSRVLMVIGRAGQGKTNFVCDLAERSLLNHGVPVLFFTGREFNHIDPERIDFYLYKSVFGESFASFDEALNNLNDLAVKLNRPISIIIDGVNEHKHIQAFSHFLELMTGRVLDYPHIKVILTCREEYFDERFSNFRTSSFDSAIHFIHNLGRSMNEMHKKQMVRGYFRFFKLGASLVSRRAAEILEDDTLLLRMFCEAYGDINAQEDIQLPPLVDIYRERVFREYLQRKIEAATEYEEDNSRIRLAPGNVYRQVLRHVVQLMIERNQFSDIPIADIPAEFHEATGSLLGEDVIVRKDLVNVNDVLDDKIEVINFTFDEFRDFLLADHLVKVVFRDDHDRFEKAVDEMVAPTSSVAEGVRTYLFFATKQANGRDVRALLKGKEWYREIFIRSIFSVEEDSISPDDLNEIKARFRDNASWIIRMLYLRWRPSLYPRLNIFLLFEIFNELDEASFNEIVRPLVRPHASLNIEALAKQLDDSLDEKEFLENGEIVNLMELLIFFFDIWEADVYSQPAFDTFAKFAELKPDSAMALLKKHTEMKQVNLRSQVWRMLTTAVKAGARSNGLTEEACQLLQTISEGDQAELRSLGVEVVRFLETVETQENLKFEDSIRSLITQYSVFPYSYVPK